MDNTQASQPTAGSKSWGPLLQFVLSLAAALIAWMIGLLLAFSGVMQFVTPNQGLQPDASTFLLASGAIAAGFLLALSAWFALLQMIGKPERWPEGLHQIARILTHPLLLITVFAVALLIGYFFSQNSSLQWLLPPLHLAAVLIPLYLIIRIGQRGLEVGSLRQAWGVFAAGLAVAPSIVMIAEILAGIVFVVIGTLYISLQPGLMQQLLSLAQSLRNPNVTQDELLRSLGPYLRRPEVIAAILAFTALVVPLIEETFKSIGVWFILKRDITPAQGFAAGLLSGAGFAFFENLTLTAQGQDWAAVVVARIGTALLHIITTGLMGWALAQTWRDRKYLRILRAYAGNVLLHGIWNATALLATAPTFDLVGTPTASQSLGLAAALVLIGMAVFLFVVMLWSNWKLQPTFAAPDLGDNHLVGG